ncbi:MAG TPA: glutathione S-transferase family protein [Bradyrhizobium sp.]|nr:glutathione S-transferase family protein [Bradyrhizobium sp.]
MLKLLGRQTSGNVQKVVFALEEMGTAYIREDYGRDFGNTTTEAYAKLNPTRKVPTLVDGGTVVWESNTILRYLAAAYAPALTGATPAERSEVEPWMDWLLASVNAAFLGVFRETKKKPEERGPEFIAASNDLVSQLRILDGHLAECQFIALGRFTIADAALAPIIKRCVGFPIDRPAFPGIEGWLGRIEARPAFQVAIGAKTSAVNTAA